MDVVWGLPRCVWARESTAPAQGNQSLPGPGAEEKAELEHHLGSFGAGTSVGRAGDAGRGAVVALSGRLGKMTAGEKY